MKKHVILLAILCLVSCVFYLIYLQKNKHTEVLPLSDTLYINTQYSEDNLQYQRIKKLEKSFNKLGIKTVLNAKEAHKEGKINLYIAENIYDLPEVKDTSAINVLWFPYIGMEDDFEVFRKFDVIIVKSFASFLHLKAINVRTAYIPDAIDIDSLKENKNNKKILYYGDNTDFSLVLYLTKGENIDIIGKGWEHTKYAKNVVRTKIKNSDFTSYPIVMVDQTDDEIKKYLINNKIINTLEKGGRLMVRYNPGIEKMFDSSIIMYYNEDDFHYKFKKIKKQIDEDNNIATDFYDKSKDWNSKSVANKIIEIFQIMQKKLINN